MASSLAWLRKDVTGRRALSIERSGRDPKAKPLQSRRAGIDRIIFRLAGLTDAESAALEQRLAKML